jgi:hypothetical protein
MGDDTKARVDDLASGWTIGAPNPPAAKVPDKPAPAAQGTPEPAPTPVAPSSSGPTGRRKARTVPPPPPGSEARKQLEDAIVDSKHDSAPKLETNPPKLETRPPKPTTRPPPIPTAMRAKTPSKPDTMFVAERTPPVIIDASLIEDPKVAASLVAGKPLPATDRMSGPVNVDKLSVPIGEFETAAPTIDDDKLRVAMGQATIKRDAADALLKVPRTDATGIATSPFERGDPTTVSRDSDATEIEKMAAAKYRATSGTLRIASMLRRKRGIAGDMRYVFTALFGVREARRELAKLEERQTLRQTSRKRHLVTLGRTAVTADAFDHPAVGKSRDALAAVEDERSKHAGAVAASDAELERVRRDRDAKSKHYATENAATATELADLVKKLEPLEKEAAGARRRATDLKDQLRKIAKQISDTEALLVSVKSEKMDRAGIQADIATLKADEKAVQRDEPAIAAEIDALEPRIAAMKGARTEAEKKQAELIKNEDEDQRRTTELYEAIGAKRKVVERAAAEAEAARDNVLFELGDRLYVDRPAILAAQMSPVDQIDLELGETDRRIMELREILSNIDRSKILRGAAVILAAALVVGMFVAWLLYKLL